MPTYQYACTECGHHFEAVQSFSDAALTDCPQCTGRLRKVFNSVGIVFKGSGFYRTDSREKKPDGESKPAAGAESTPAASAGKQGAAEKSTTSGTATATPKSSSGSSSTGSSTAGSAA